MKKILGSPHSRSHRPLSHNELDKQPKLRDVITRTHKTRLLVAYIKNRKRTFIILWPWTLTFENNLDMIKYVGQRSLSSKVIVRTRTLYLEVGNCYTMWRQNWRYASHFWDGSQVCVRDVDSMTTARTMPCCQVNSRVSAKLTGCTWIRRVAPVSTSARQTSLTCFSVQPVCSLTTCFSSATGRTVWATTEKYSVQHCNVLLLSFIPKRPMSEMSIFTLFFEYRLVNSL